MAAYFKIVVLLMASAASMAVNDDPYGKQPLMPYDFSYAVKDDYSGNDFGHSENSDGNIVKGEYFVLLPDGRRQLVTYTADHENGFVANVQYEGEAQYPPPAPSQRANGYPQ